MRKRKKRRLISAPSNPLIFSTCSLLFAISQIQASKIYNPDPTPQNVFNRQELCWDRVRDKLATRVEFEGEFRGYLTFLSQQADSGFLYQQCCTRDALWASNLPFCFDRRVSVDNRALDILSSIRTYNISRNVTWNPRETGDRYDSSKQKLIKAFGVKRDDSFEDWRKYSTSESWLTSPSDQQISDYAECCLPDVFDRIAEPIENRDKIIMEGVDVAMTRFEEFFGPMKERI